MKRISLLLVLNLMMVFADLAFKSKLIAEERVQGDRLASGDLDGGDLNGDNTPDFVFARGSLMHNVINRGAGAVVFAEAATAQTKNIKTSSDDDYWPYGRQEDWTLVRRQVGGSWHAATDNLNGTAVYGTPGGEKSATAFSVTFSINPADKILFMSGDRSVWLVATYEEISKPRANGYGAILASSDHPTSPSRARWYNRPNFPEDPWLSIVDHTSAAAQGKMVYGEASWACSLCAQQGGMNVFLNDIDECDLGTDNCGNGALCSNQPAGSFTCACPAGQSGNPLMDDSCQEADECAEATDNCNTHADCADTAGSFTCTCHANYEGDGVLCEDIDECATGSHACASNATCLNEPGTYSCACLSGYQGDPRSVCTDIDECDEGTANCANNADCSNTAGGFTCTCQTGYEGNGATCEDIDECSAGTSDCENVCINAPGSWTCEDLVPILTVSGSLTIEVDSQLTAEEEEELLEGLKKDFAAALGVDVADLDGTVTVESDSDGNLVVTFEVSAPSTVSPTDAKATITGGSFLNNTLTAAPSTVVTGGDVDAESSPPPAAASAEDSAATGIIIGVVAGVIVIGGLAFYFTQSRAKLQKLNSDIGFVEEEAFPPMANSDQPTTQTEDNPQDQEEGGEQVDDLL